MKKVVSFIALTNLIGVAVDTYEVGINKLNIFGKNWKFNEPKFSKKFEKL